MNNCSTTSLFVTLLFGCGGPSIPQDADQTRSAPEWLKDQQMCRTVFFGTLGLCALLGTSCSRDAPRDAKVAKDNMAVSRLESAGDQSVTLLFVLPDAKPMSRTTADEWGFAAPIESGFANPNRIVYDDLYIKKYIDAPSEIKCGRAVFQIGTPRGIVQFFGDPNHTYLGRRFRAKDLISFLKTRTEGRCVEREFQFDNPAFARALQENPDPFMKLRVSPWDRDLRVVILLLGDARYEPAYPVIKDLLDDASLTVRLAAVKALGYLSQDIQAADEDLRRLLKDKELGGRAFNALRVAEEIRNRSLDLAEDSP
jgi:hypothetical protein